MTSELSRRALIAGAAMAPVSAWGQPQVGAPQTRLRPPYPVVGRVERYDASLDRLIDVDARVEKIMDGFVWSEGPVWVGGPDGYLLVSDPRTNRITRWSSRDGGSVWMQPSGYVGPGRRGWDPIFAEPGANGLMLGRGGLLMCDHGNRQIALVDLRTKRKTPLATHFEGKRFNSPNDLAIAPNGMIYFTDPPWGLTGGLNSKSRELDFTGVFRLAPDNTVTLVDRTLIPNGIGVAPDGSRLYVADRSGWIMWDLDAQGNPSNRRHFVTRATGIMGGDSLRIDADGNMWTSSRDGISIFNPQGVRIGIVRMDDSMSSCEIGNDGYLYVTSNTRLVRVKVKGARKQTPVSA